MLVTALGLTACTNDDEPGGGPGKEVKITTSIATEPGDQSGTRAVIDPATGAGNLENDDVIRLGYISSEGKGAGLNYRLGSSTMYWDALTDAFGAAPYTFDAHYPATPNGTFDVATAAEPDILGARTEGVADGADVNLVFSHLMHRLTVNLTSTIFTAEQLAAATVTPVGLKSEAKIEEGQCLPLDTGDDAYPAKTGAGTSHIIAPQSVTPGEDLLEITIAGQTRRYKVPTTLTALESGKRLTLNLGLTNTGVVPTPADILTEANFPDAAFRAWLKTQATDAWGDKDGKLTAAEAAAVTEIVVYGKGIADLTGIGHFTALTELDCDYNDLTALDVTKNTALTKLNCYDNDLAALDVTANTVLTELRAGSGCISSVPCLRRECF
jgi:hypothetical protein